MTGHRSVGAAVLRAVLALGLLVGRGNCNRFQEAWVMNCDHTFPDGTTYDLSAMTRTAGRPDYVGRDKVGNMYYMNVCGDVQEIPKECRALQKAIRSPAYQVRNDSYCHWLGLDAKHEWDFIEAGSPFVGVQITYKNGEYCREGVDRRVKLQIYCDHLGRLGSVGDYYVTQEDACTWVVTFPSAHGCPVAARSSAATLMLIVVSLVMLAYCGGGLALNVTKHHMPLSVEALPHIDFWRRVPGIAHDAAAAVVDLVLVKLGRREPPGYSGGMGGSEFEWSGL